MLRTNAKHPIAPSFSVIESKLYLLLSSSHDVVTPAWHLMLLYIAAVEYSSSIRKLSSANSNREVVFTDVKRVREVAKTLKYHADVFAAIYEQFLEIHLEEWSESAESEISKSRNTRPSGSLIALHRKYSRPLLRRLQNAGCSEQIAKRFVDDALDLLWELESFTRQVGKLANIRKDDRANLSSVIWKVCYPWQHINFHLRYHLGEFEGSYSGLYNPGVLGWSLAALSEINYEETRKTGLKSVTRQNVL
jgi:hypothetical protein